MNGVNSLTWVELRVVTVAWRLALGSVAWTSPTKAREKIDRNKPITVGRRGGNLHSRSQAALLKWYQKKLASTDRKGLLPEKHLGSIQHLGLGQVEPRCRMGAKMCDLSHVRSICHISTWRYGNLSAACVVCPSVEGRSSQVDLQLIPDLRCPTTLSLVVFGLLILNDGFKLFIRCPIRT